MPQATKHQPERPEEMEQRIEDLSYGIKRPFQVSDMISKEKLITLNGLDYLLKSILFSNRLLHIIGFS
jgi:hypothetical protein